MVRIVHSSKGNPSPTHNTPAYSQRRLFGSGHLLQEQQVLKILHNSGSVFEKITNFIIYTPQFNFEGSKWIKSVS